MFIQGHLLLVLFSVLVVSTSPFPSAEASASRVSATSDITTPLYPSNASFSSLDNPAENSLRIKCDGGTYGYNPSIPDCESISKYLIPNDKIWTFKQRSMDLQPDTAPLPLLQMGDEALCYTQALLDRDYSSAKASITMLRNAAAALVTQCAKGRTSQGGMATNIGGDNYLAVVLGIYPRKPTCNEESASVESCRYILATMPADVQSFQFGPQASPFATPYHMRSGDGGCTATIDIRGRAYEMALFWDIWVVVNAIFAVCSRKNKGGVMRGLGDHGRIYVTMSAGRRLELPSNTSVITTS